MEKAPILHRLLIEGIKRHPLKQAVTDGSLSYTFQQLHQGSTKLAEMLIARGVRKGDRILVIAEKCAEIVIIVTGIWKAGAVYVPIDPANPASRNEYLCASIQPVAIIAREATQINFDLPYADPPVIFFREALKHVDEQIIGREHFPELNREDLAYIMHTSGSTGEPKGVMITHGNVADYFINHNEVLRFTSDSYCMSFAPCYFDVSIEDTFLPLSVGASVYQYRGLPAGGIVLKLLAREKITHLIAVSTLLTIITGDGTAMRKTDLSHLEMVMTGAEVCDTRVIDLWKAIVPAARIYNVYGPTETTIVCTAYQVKDSEPQRTGYYPIGRPLSNVHALLLDETGEPIRKPWVQGELLIGGSQVMKGYWNDENLTNRVIVEHKGIRHYRTGDICCWDDNGDLVFCGRNDEEIKLSGRRINLLEIKKCILEADPAIRQAAIGCITCKDRKMLAAVIVTESGFHELTLPALKNKLREKLSPYAVPECVGLEKDLVLSATGKTNSRKMLDMLEKAANDATSEFFILDQGHEFLPLRCDAIVGGVK